MTTKARMIKQLIPHGWVLNRWGHLEKNQNGRTYRYKFQKRTWRREIKSSSGWVKLAGQYYSKTGDLIHAGRA